MTASGHALIGAAIITKIPDLRISLPLVLLSHLLADMPEHWDTGTNWRQKTLRKVFSDTLIDLGLGYLLVTLIFILWLQANPINIFFGVLISQLPDFLEVPYFFLRWHFAPWSWINRFNQLYHKKITLPWNLTLTALNQAILSGLFILWAAIK